MFKKIFKFFVGYVIIRVFGKNSERFLSMCVKNRLAVSDVIPVEGGLEMTISVRDYPKIRRLVRKSGVRVRRVAAGGFPARRRAYAAHMGFFAAAAAVAAALVIIPGRVCMVEIDGARLSDTSGIEEILREHGVYVGAKRSGIDDLTEIKNDIVHHMPNVTWAWLYVDGIRARLEVAETGDAPEIADKETPTDIVAVCDGRVVRATVKRGERRVNTGSAVSAGDVLVSGTVAVFREGTEEKYIKVHSDAEIRAETVRHESGTFSRKETLTVRTGLVRRRFAAELFGRRFDFYRDDGGGFDEYEAEERRHTLKLPLLGDMPVTWITRTVRQTRETERSLDTDEVLSRAKETLEARICGSLGAGAEKTDERLIYSENDGVYTVELRMRFIENIGMEVPAEE